MAVAAGADRARQGAVHEDRLAAVAVGVLGLDGEVGAAPGQRRLEARHRGLLAEEVAVQLDEAHDVGLGQGHLVGQLAGALEALLQAERVERRRAEVLQAVFLPGFPEGVVDLGHLVQGHVQLPAELADVGDAERAHRRAGHVDLPGLEPGEGLVVERRLGHLAQDVARRRAREHQAAVVRRLVGDRHILAVPVLFQPVHDPEFVEGGEHQVEAVVRQARAGHLGLDRALAVQEVAEHDPADLARRPVGDHAVEEGLRVRAAHVDLGEGGEVQDAGPFAHRLALCGDAVEGGRAPEALVMALLDAGTGEPHGPLPAEDLLVDRTRLLQALEQRRGLDRAGGRAVAVREGRLVA